MDGTQLIQRWNDGVTALITHRDSSDILDRFLYHLLRCVDFDQWYAVIFHQKAKAKRIGSYGIHCGKDDYENGIFLLDPFYEQFQSTSKPSVHRLDDISNSVDPAYFEDYYLGKWKTRDEIGYIVQISDDQGLHFSVSRSTKMAEFKQHEISFLSTLVSVVDLVFKLHLEHIDRVSDSSVCEPKIHTLIENKLCQFIEPALSPREAQIASLLLKGYNAFGIAEVIDVTPGTVKNHIKSIYRKLHVNSQVDLLVAFMDHLYD